MEGNCTSARIDRREFLKVAAVAGGGILLAASGSHALAEGGDTKVAIPTVDGSTVIQVRNLADQAASVTLVFKPSSGGATYTKIQAAPPNSSTTFYLPDFRDIPPGLQGPAEVTSASQKITVVVSTRK